MSLSAFESEVDTYYTRSTPVFYLQGWDLAHLHLGIFDPQRNPIYENDLSAILADRTSAVAAMTDRILGQVPVAPGLRVVDAGCGVGGTAIALARLGCVVTGVNLNELQLEIARKASQDAGASADFVWGNCSQGLPFADSSVDLVVNIESACHYADRPRFLAEVARVLKPGGRLAASDWIAKPRLTVQESEKVEAMCRAWHLAPPLESLSSYRQLLEVAGLRMVSKETLGDEVRANGLVFEHAWRATRSFPPVLMNAEQREYQEQNRTFADTFLSGLFRLGLYSAVKPA